MYNVKLINNQLIFFEDGEPVVYTGAAGLSDADRYCVAEYWTDHQGNVKGLATLITRLRACQHDWQEAPDAEPPYDICSKCGLRQD